MNRRNEGREKKNKKNNINDREITRQNQFNIKYANMISNINKPKNQISNVLNKLLISHHELYIFIHSSLRILYSTQVQRKLEQK